MQSIKDNHKPSVLSQGLALQPRLASNSKSSCFSLLGAAISSMYHHAWLKTS
jgi:hypothetical protein